MSITRRCDYACRIIRAAYKNGESYVSIAEVAEQEQIPYSFARSIQHELVKAGLLRTIRGVHGGLVLNCDPSEVSLYDVLRSVSGETLSVAECTNCDYLCCHKGNCSFNAVWLAADKMLRSLYSSITLAELFEQGRNHPVIQAAFDLDFNEFRTGFDAQGERGVSYEGCSSPSPIAPNTR